MAIFVFGKQPSGIDLGLVIGGYLIALMTARAVRSSGGSNSILSAVGLFGGVAAAIIGIIRVHMG